MKTLIFFTIRRTSIKLFVLFVLLFSSKVRSQTCGNDVCELGENDTTCIRDCRLESIVLLRQNGGRVDWSNRSDSLIAFDNNVTGYFEVYTMNPNTSDTICLTCSNTLFQKHCGNPAWHPSGDWIVFQAEKNVHPGGSNFSTPGKGVYNDLWLTNANGTQFYQLTNNPVSDSIGSLHPHFSHDGMKLSWSEMYEPSVLWPLGKTFGSFKLKIADFSFDSLGIPHLTNITEYVPNDSVIYENHGFSPDGADLLFMTNWNINTLPLGNCKIYKMNLTTLACTQLTSTAYNEHACYSPDGNYIVYGSAQDNSNKGMDYWIMKSDGTEKQRLTYFNQVGYPECLTKAYAVDMSWSPDGKHIVSFVEDSTLNDGGSIYLITFSDPLGPATSINEIIENSNERCTIYPNPFNSNTAIYFNPKAINYKIVIYNMFGKVIQIATNFSGDKFEINRNNLPSGLYLIQISHKNEIIETKKLLIN